MPYNTYKDILGKNQSIKKWYYDIIWLDERIKKFYINDAYKSMFYTNMFLNRQTTFKDRVNFLARV